MHVASAYTPVASIFILKSISHNQLKYFTGKTKTFDWFKSFICDRVQYTWKDLKESSTKVLVSHEVPQGSVLGSLLFVIFTFSSLNTSKTQIIIFRPTQKQITKHLNFRINRQKIYTYSEARYLGVVLEEHLNWNLHMNLLKCKCNSVIEILSKIRHYVPKFLLNTL